MLVDYRKQGVKLEWPMLSHHDFSIGQNFHMCNSKFIFDGIKYATVKRAIIYGK